MAKADKSRIRYFFVIILNIISFLIVFIINSVANIPIFQIPILLIVFEEIYKCAIIFLLGRREIDYFNVPVLFGITELLVSKTLSVIFMPTQPSLLIEGYPMLYISSFLMHVSTGLIYSRLRRKLGVGLVICVFLHGLFNVSRFYVLNLGLSYSMSILFVDSVIVIAVSYYIYLVTEGRLYGFFKKGV